MSDEINQEKSHQYTDISGPLSGIKVVECAHWHLAPIAGQVLGDLGADVVKIEERERGDPTRGISNVGDVTGQVTGRSLYFECGNRNKRGIVVDLKKEKGQKLVYELVKSSDIFITNLRQKALESLKIDYERISSYNPMIIYAYGSGWGSAGEYADRPALEPVTLAKSGAMYSLGEGDMPPVLYATSLGDTIGAWVLVQAILAALVARERLGFGQKVEVSLFGSLIAWQALPISTKSITGIDFPRRSRRDYRNPLYNFYKCADGKWIQLAMAQSDRYWPDFCRAMGISQLEKDNKFRDSSARKQNAEEIVAILDGLFVKKPLNEWLTFFSQAEGDFIYGPINRASELLTDPQALANEYITDSDHCVWGHIKTVGLPYKFSRSPGSLRRAAPEFGEHTEEILLEMGYTWEDISQLKMEEVI